jgi:PAS domain S-box-containing protein
MTHTHFLTDQLDYIFFFYGLSFIILGTVCLNLHKHHRQKTDPPWKWLSLFAFTHGGNEWLDMLAIALGDTPGFLAARTAVMALSFIFLFEFGRQELMKSHPKLAAPWSLLVCILLAMTGASYGPAGVNATCRYFLGFTGACLSAWACLSAARNQPENRRFYFYLPAVLFFAYGCASGLVTPKNVFFPASLLHHDSFWDWTKIPVQLIRALLATSLGSILWFYFESLNEEQRPAGKRFFGLIPNRPVFLWFLGVLLGGWGLTNGLQYYSESNLIGEHTDDLDSTVAVFNNQFQKIDQMAQSISGAPYLLLGLKDPVPESLEKTNSLLDRYQRSFSASVCYLMDLTGKTIASSNRNNVDSFLGQNYAHRAYFQTALKGRAGGEIHAGITSRRKGYYASYPVRDENQNILGVVVIKLDLSAGMMGNEHISFLLDPRRTVFISNDPRYEGQSFSAAPIVNPEAEAASSQAGTLRAFLDRRRVMLDQKKYYLFEKITRAPGWAISILVSSRIVNEYRLTGILVTGFVSGILIIFFHALKQKEISYKTLLAETVEKQKIALMFQKSQQMLRLVLDHIPARVFWKDTDSRYLGCNEACARDMGLATPDLAVGKSDSEFVWATAASRYRADDLEVITSGKAKLNYEENVPGQNGEIRWVRTSKIPMLGPDGKINGLIGIYEDITEYRTLFEGMEKLAAIVESSEDAILSIDLKGNVISWNAGAEKIYGYSAEEMKGRSVKSLLPPDRPDEFSVFIKKIKQGLAVDHFETSRVRKNGRIINVSVSISPVRNASGEIVGASSIARDITESKRVEKTLRENAQTMAAVTSSAQDAILMMDPAGNICFWNQAATRIFGYQAGEALGKNLHRFLAPQRYLGAHLQALPHFQISGEGPVIGKTLELRALRKDRQEIDIELSISSVELDGQWHAVGILRDITQRKNMEAELSRSNAELEQFAYVASHDLQEPLRMVTSYVQLLARRYQNKLDKDADDFIRFAVDGTERMRGMINDLLDYSRAIRHPLRPLEVPCGAILEKTLANLTVAIEESRASVTCGPLPVITADEPQMIRLFQNLISNAIKFRSSKPPEVRVTAEETDREWIFAVADNGIGFAPEYSERIFVIFQRLHTRNEYSGSGIGLAVCKKIVERHGGRIWAKSEPGAGATFFFTIPKKGL